MQYAEQSLAETSHTGPHIPSLSGEGIGFSVGPMEITSTLLSTWVFMVVLFVIIWLFHRANPKIKAIGMDLISRLDIMCITLIGNKEKARQFFPLLAWFFVFIFLANIFWLLLDFINLIIPSMHAYLRPINSDINTTLILGTSTILIAQATGIFVKGIREHFGHYVINFSGTSFMEKGISFFIWWLHFIGEFIRIGSLSLRLFLNIFVGVILISVAVYIGHLLPGHGIGAFITLPFWFFELLVAFLQAYIFMTLSGLYIKEALTHHHDTSKVEMSAH